jgi:hypothetical protein
MSGIIGGAGSKSGVIGQTEKKAVDAWVNFGPDGTINADYNISGVSGTVSPYTVSFEKNMAGSAKYAATAGTGALSSSAQNFATGTNDLVAGSYTWQRESSSGVAATADGGAGSSIVIGEQ